ncbi:allophanate hydrolase-related protein [Saccharomonospora piscinae]|uniref:allophanate hydrolase-related protein n=1 Tax=Saccharomonospora piscinae TaxID=687388 RepID=UPI000464168D|nr:amidase [Saccharomonospora piscinae]
MNLFLFDDDTVPLPPITTSQAVQRVLSVFDALHRGTGPAPVVRLRVREEVLVEAKAVDERVRAGERLPLVGTLVAIPDRSVLAARLAAAGAVVAGYTVPGVVATGAPARLETLSKLDALVLTEPPLACRDVVGFVPTRGLLPLAAAGAGTVLARDAAVAQEVASAVTGADPSGAGSRSWPDSVRLSAGAAPRVGVPGAAFRSRLDPAARERLLTTADTLRVAGAITEDVDLGVGEDWCARRAAFALRDHDALVVPAERGTNPFATLIERLDTAAVVLPAGDGGAVAVVTTAFDDQVALDLAGLLTGAQAASPYPDVGVELVAFGAYLRGQPRAGELERLGARFVRFVTTTRHYRMVLIGDEPPEAGVLRAGEPWQGGPLVGERWLLSPSALGEFVAHLPATMRLGTVELADGSNSPAILCDPVTAERGDDITGWECWRAYLRHLSALRPSTARAGR